MEGYRYENGYFHEAIKFSLFDQWERIKGDCRQFSETAANPAFSSGPCPCPCQSAETAHTHINQLLITHTFALSVKLLSLRLQFYQAPCCVLFVSGWGSAATVRQWAAGHMLLPSERSGNKCATNGGPSTPPSSFSSYSSSFSSYTSSWRQGINSSWWM